MESGRLSEANTLLTDAGAAQKRILGEEHPETLTTMSRIARLYERQSRRKEAEYLYRETAEASIRAPGEKHPRIEARLENLNRFEHVRRSSESAVSVLSAKSGEPCSKQARGLSVNMQKLTMVEEIAQENETE